MSAYATLTDLRRLASEARLVDLTDRAEVATGTVDEAIVAQALEDASALIDGYLAGRYTLPLATVPPVLRQVCARLAYYGLHIEHVPEKVAEDRKADLRWLERVASGAVTLVTDAGAEAPASADVRYVAPDRKFIALGGY